MSDIPDRLAAVLADRYRSERELGQGGMATVYLAEDVKHRKLAIKVLKPELAAVLGADRFEQEIKATAALQHPHILPLFDSGTAGGSADEASTAQPFGTRSTARPGSHSMSLSGLPTRSPTRSTTRTGSPRRTSP